MMRGGLANNFAKTCSTIHLCPQKFSNIPPFLHLFFTFHDDVFSKLCFRVTFSSEGMFPLAFFSHVCVCGCNFVHVLYLFLFGKVRTVVFLVLCWLLSLIDLYHRPMPIFGWRGLIWKALDLPIQNFLNGAFNRLIVFFRKLWVEYFDKQIISFTCTYKKTWGNHKPYLTQPWSTACLCTPDNRRSSAAAGAGWTVTSIRTTRTTTQYDTTGRIIASRSARKTMCQ